MNILSYFDIATYRRLKPEENDKMISFIFIILFRIACLFVWIALVSYSCFQVYLAAEEHLPWNRDPVMNPGPLTSLFNRGRDVSDFEWITYTYTLFTQLLFWLPIFLLVSRFTRIIWPQKILYVSPILSLMFLNSLIGLSGTIFLFFIPLLYQTLIFTKNKAYIWISTIILLLLINLEVVKEQFSTDSLSEYYFLIISAWTLARAVSFSLDTLDIEEESSNTNNKKTEDKELVSKNLGSLLSYYSYSFYFPIVMTGPFIMYHHYMNHIEKKHEKNIFPALIKLVLNLVRFGFWIFIIEVMIHFLYFRSLSLSLNLMEVINLWALCGIIYLLGQFFMTKYFVIYGVSSCIAEFDGIPMPRLPRCIAYVHRYSTIWKDFDRGLYDFLVRYTYKPSLKFLNENGHSKELSIEIKKSIASLITFSYVYIWHSISFEVFVWSLFNFIGVTIEKLAGLVKMKIIDNMRRANSEIPGPMFWECLVEPIVVIPLAAMSVVNSSIFCGSLEFAKLFLYRIWRDREYNYAFQLMYIFTHLAIGIQTLPKFILEVKHFLDSLRIK